MADTGGFARREDVLINEITTGMGANAGYRTR
jgi:hypothetical protein